MYYTSVGIFLWHPVERFERFYWSFSLVYPVHDHEDARKLFKVDDIMLRKIEFFLRLLSRGRHVGIVTSEARNDTLIYAANHL